MTSTAQVLIIGGYGTTGDNECVHAAQLAKADKVVLAHFADLGNDSINLNDFNCIILPGGFRDGDDLGAAQAALQRWKYTKTAQGLSLADALSIYAQKQGNLLLGIGNGFQLLAKLGLVPNVQENPDGRLEKEQEISFTNNLSGRFEDRWCHVKVNPLSPCVFTAGITSLYLPVRQGQGRFVTLSEHITQKLIRNNQLVLEYVTPDGETALDLPYNPSGSELGIAGICDSTGRIFGLMPHPESYNHPTNHPSWSSGEQSTLGIALFENAVRYLQKA